MKARCSYAQRSILFKLATLYRTNGAKFKFREIEELKNVQKNEIKKY